MSDGGWRIVDFENNTTTSKETFNRKWGGNSPKSAEAATMLDVLEHAKGSTPMNLEGETIAINDSRLLNNEINENWKRRTMRE